MRWPGFIAILPLAGWEMAETPFEITAQAIWATVYLGVMVNGRRAVAVALPGAANQAITTSALLKMVTILVPLVKV